MTRSAGSSAPEETIGSGSQGPTYCLAPRAGGAQRVEREPADDGGQPGVEVVDRVRAGALEPQPRLLHDVLRLAQVAELAVGEAEQSRARPREALRNGHAANDRSGIMRQPSMPARTRGLQPVASRSRRLEMRCERATGSNTGGTSSKAGRKASRPTTAASAASISPRVGGSSSATLYVPAGAPSAATTAVAASSSQTVGRYASRRPRLGEMPAPRGLDVGQSEAAVGPDEEAEAQHDGRRRTAPSALASAIERGRRRGAAHDGRVLVEPRVAAVGVHERERLLDQAPGAGRLRRQRDDGRRLAAQPVVLVPRAGRRHALGGRDAGEQVHDGVGAGERVGHGGLVEDVGLDGAGAEALEQPPGARRPHDAGDPMAGGEQFGDYAPPDDAGGSSDHDVHDQLTRHAAES